MVDEEWIRELIRTKKLYKFYKTPEWLTLRQSVLEEQHNECEWCRERGKITGAVEVHHVQWVKKHPELALSRTYTFNGEERRNLIALCHDCHDSAHDRIGHAAPAEQFNQERW